MALSVTCIPPGIVITVPCAAPPHVWCPYTHACASNMPRDGMQPQRGRSCPASHDQGPHGDRMPHPGSSVTPTTANKRKRHQPKPFSHTSQTAHFGDALSKKKPHNLRIWYNNINGLSSSTLTDKAPDLLTLQSLHQIDIICLAESNSNWSSLPFTKSIESRLHYDPRTPFTASTAYNTHKRLPIHQQGGTAIACFGSMALSTLPTSNHTHNDPTGLGRWTSILFESHCKPNLRIVIAYNPCHGTASKSSFNSVYCQHKRYLINKKQDLTDPRAAFRRDFFQRLYSWKN